MSSPYMRVCADPFNAPPVGLPDEYEGLTVPIKLRTATNITTNNAGAYLATFTGRIDGTATDSYANSATLTAGTTTITGFTGTDHGDLTSFSTNFRYCRPISAGIKVYYTGAEATTSGILSVGHLEGLQTTTVSSTEFPLAVEEWIDLPGVYSHSCASMTEPLMAICRNYDRPVFANVATDVKTYFPSLFTAGVNLPASLPVVRVECVLNLECIPFIGNQISSHLTSKVPPSYQAIEMVGRRLSTAKSGLASIVQKPLTIGSGSKPRSSKKKKRTKKRSARRMTSSARVTMRYPGMNTYKQVSRGTRGAKRKFTPA